MTSCSAHDRSSMVRALAKLLGSQDATLFRTRLFWLDVE